MQPLVLGKLQGARDRMGAEASVMSEEQRGGLG
jgi:hypothetical protein